MLVRVGYVFSSLCFKAAGVLCLLLCFPCLPFAQSGPILSYSTYLANPVDPFDNISARGLSVNSSGTACVTDGKRLYMYDVNGKLTLTIPDTASVAPGIVGGLTATDEQGNCFLAGVANPAATGGTVFGNIGFGMAKFSPSGALLYSAYFGGSSGASGSLLTAIAVDLSDNIYVTGETSSSDWPLKNPFQNLLKGPEDAFVLKLDPTGTSLIYSTYFGGGSSGTSLASGIAFDTQGNAYITGLGANIPVTPGVFQGSPNTSSGSNGFVAKFDATGRLVYATYLGGSQASQPAGVGVDSSGNAYIGGRTCETDFPTKNPFQANLQGPCNGFVSKLTADATALVYSTYLGGSEFNIVTAIAVDNNGAAYVTGLVNGSGANFPIIHPVQSEYLNPIPGSGSQTHPFITVFNGSGSALQYSTFFDGFDTNLILGLGIDAADNVYVGGSIGGPQQPPPAGFPILAANNGVFFPFGQAFGCSPMVGCPTLGFAAKISPNSGTALSSPSTVDFGTQPMSTSPGSAAQILIVNVGPTNIQVNNTAITGDYTISNNTCVGTLVSAIHCEVDVKFAPSAGGTRTGVLTLTSNAPDSPRNIQLTGIGGVPMVSLNPTALNLTSPKVGAAGPMQTVVLTNTGADVLNISSLSITGPNAADFSETHNCASTVGAGHSCNVNVTYTASTANPESASLQLTDNAAGSPQTVPLTGVVSAFGLVVAPGASPSATISAGQTATYNLMIGGAGFSGNVSLSCSGAPAAATCNVPNSETLGSAPISFQAMVSTTARSNASLSHIRLDRMFLGAFAVCLTLTFMALLRMSRAARLLALCTACLGVILIASCGGGGGNSGGGAAGTPAGSYTLTVTASNGSNTQTMNLMLNVN